MSQFKGARGLTLAEIMVSLGILSFLIVTTIMLFTTLVAGASKNSGRAAAQTFTAQTLERVAQEGTFATLTGGDIYTTDPITKTRYSYRVQSEAVPGDSAKGYLGGYFITVETWWNTDSANQVTHGEGYRSVRASRFVYSREMVP
jgi:Tfp pilus assembly protein PilE